MDVGLVDIGSLLSSCRGDGGGGGCGILPWLVLVRSSAGLTQCCTLDRILSGASTASCRSAVDSCSRRMAAPSSVASDWFPVGTISTSTSRPVSQRGGFSAPVRRAPATPSQVALSPASVWVAVLGCIGASLVEKALIAFYFLDIGSFLRNMFVVIFTFLDVLHLPM